jgi:hypothetical protein
MPQAPAPAPTPAQLSQLQPWMRAPPAPVKIDYGASSQQPPGLLSRSKPFLLAPLPKPTQDPENPATLPSDYYAYRDKGWSEEELEKLRKKKKSEKR